MGKNIGLDAFQAKADNLELPMGLVVDHLTLTTGRATAVTDPFSLSLAEPGDVRVEISESNVARYLEELAPGGLKNFQVECRDEFIVVRATVRFLLEVPVYAQCRLVIHEGRELHVELVEAQVVGGDAKRLVEGQIERVNPIFRVSDIPFPLVLDEVLVREGYITLLGTADMPQSS